MAFTIASPLTISLCQAVSQAIHARARWGALAGYTLADAAYRDVVTGKFGVISESIRRDMRQAQRLTFTNEYASFLIDPD
jgi:hypothetical protein